MKLLILIFLSFLSVLDAIPTKEKESKQLDFLGLSALNVVVFPNDPCGEAPNIGTCYRENECQDRGGEAGPACAQGFGVCCRFNLECGDTTSENNTFLTLAATTNIPVGKQTCTYKICSMSAAVARIRLDFTTFNIVGPFAGRARLAPFAVEDLNRGGSIGDCIGDTFQLMSPGNAPSPVICGFNTGQHMIVDASVECVTAIFHFDRTDTTTSREYSIQAMQYILGDEMGGPLDCLQYFTGLTGTVSSFNFPTNQDTVPAATTHLSSQNYNICFRRESGRCGICFIPAVTIKTIPDNTALTQTSFGLSSSGLGAVPMQDPAITKSLAEGWCDTDFIVIPGGMIPANVNVDENVDGVERFCGRVFNTERTPEDITTTTSVCTTRTPFRIFFRTNGNEAEYDTQESSMAQAMAQDVTTNEEIGFPGGIIGFSLDFSQSVTC